MARLLLPHPANQNTAGARALLNTSVSGLAAILLSQAVILLRESGMALATGEFVLIGA